MREVDATAKLGPGESAAGFDCLACGACCRAARDGRLLVYEDDLVRWRREGRRDLIDRTVPGHFGEVAFACTEEGACVHLGTDASPNACAIYATRGWTCHALEPGSRQCRDYRRERGMCDP